MPSAIVSAVCASHKALATNIYADFNGTTAGFGTAASTSETALNWDTASDGTGTSSAFVSNDVMVFGTSASPISGTFSVSLNASGTNNLGFTLTNSGQVITLTASHGTAGGLSVWNVAAGSTLIDDCTNTLGTNSGFNFNNRQCTLSGDGTIDFQTLLGANDTNTITENGTLAVNLETGPTGTASGNGAFSGNFTLAAGTLNFSTASSANAFSGFGNTSVFAINGGTIDNTSASAQTLSLAGSLGAGSYSIGGSFTFTGSSSLSFGSAPVALANTPTITVGANTLTIAGSITGSSNLQIAGPGTLALAGANSYVGYTFLSSGSLNLANASALGATGNTLFVGNASTVQLLSDTAFGSGSNPLYNVTFNSSGSYTPTISLGRQTAGATTPITHNFGTLTISLSGNGAGGLNVTAGANAPAGSAVDTLAFASLSFGNYFNVTETLAPAGANLIIGSVAPIVSQAGAGNTSVQTLDLDGTSTGNQITGAITDTNASTGNNQTAILKTNTSTWTLSGSNTYTGTTTLSGGTLQLQANSGNTDAGNVAYALPAGTGQLTVTPGTTIQLRSDSAVTFAGGDGALGLGNGSFTFDVNQLATGSNQALSFGANGFSTFNTVLNVTGGNGYVLKLGPINGSNGTLTLNPTSANVTIASIASQTTLYKTGAGTVFLTGSSTYSGGTVISAGTIRANGSAQSLGTGTVNVNSGGTLGGNGAVGNGNNLLAVNSGATITAGADANTSGQLTAGKMSLNGGSVYLAKINDSNTSGKDTPGLSSTWDNINMSSLNVTGSGHAAATSVTIEPVGTVTGVSNSTVWQIIHSSSRVTINGGTEDGTSISNAPNLLTDAGGAFALDTSYFSVNGVSNPGPTQFRLELVGGRLDLIYSPSPEPDAVVLALGGAAPILLMRRRRQTEAAEPLGTDVQA